MRSKAEEEEGQVEKPHEKHGSTVGRDLAADITPAMIKAGIEMVPSCKLTDLTQHISQSHNEHSVSSGNLGNEHCQSNV